MKPESWLRFYFVYMFFAVFFSPTFIAQITQVNHDTVRPSPGSGHDYIQMFNETINPENGSLNIQLSLPLPASRGFTLPFSINYNSGSVWSLIPSQTAETDCAAPSDPYSCMYRYHEYEGLGVATGPYAQYGWSYSVPTVSYTHGNQPAAVPGTGNVPVGSPASTVPCYYDTDYMFYAPDGGTHSLGLLYWEEVINVEINPCGSLSLFPDETQTPSNVLFSGDEIYQAGTTTYDTSQLSIADRSGKVYSFNSAVSGNLLYTLYPSAEFNNISSTNGPHAIAKSVEDSNGNIYTINASSLGGKTAYTDTSGREALSITAFGGSTNAATPDAITVKGFTNPFLVSWEILSLNQNSQTGTSAQTLTCVEFAPSATVVDPASAPLNSGTNGSCYAKSFSGTADACNFSTSLPVYEVVVNGITLPNGDEYKFGYDAQFGLLNQITYPNGARVVYSWGDPRVFSNSHTFASSATWNWNNPQWPDSSGPINSPSCGALYSMPAIEKREIYYDGVTLGMTQTFDYTTNWQSLPNGASIQNAPQWNSKQTVVTTEDNIAGTVSSKTYSYVGTLGYPQPLDYARGIPYSQVPMELSVITDDLQKKTQIWAAPNQLICDSTQLGPSVSTAPAALTYYLYATSTGNPTRSGQGAQVQERKDYDYGVLSSCQLVPPSNQPTRDTLVGSYHNFGSATLFPFGPYILDHPDTVTESGTGGNSLTSSYSYDDSGSVDSSASGEPQHDSSYAYGSSLPRGNLTTVVKQGIKNTYTYDETGNRTSFVDGNGWATGNLTSHTYKYTYADSPSGSTFAYLTAIQRPTTANGIQHKASFSYDYTSGVMVSAVDENGNMTKYQYVDPFQRLTRIDYPDGGAVEKTYVDGASPSVTTCQRIALSSSSTINCDASSKTTGWLTTNQFMDGIGRIIRSQVYSDPVAPDNVDAKYDGYGRIYTKTNPYRSGDTSYGITQFAYDGISRPTLVTNSDGTTHAFTYNNNSTLYTDENLNKWTRYYDRFEQLETVYEPDPASSSSRMETDYTYDALGNMLSVVQHGGSKDATGPRNRSFTYDNLSRLVTSQNSETGTVCYGQLSGSSCVESYDANSNILQKTDARGVTVAYSYDALNRMLSKTYPANTGTTMAYNYDSSSVSGATNTVGQLTQATVYSGTKMLAQRSSFIFDSMGRLQNETQCTFTNCSGNSYTPVYTYDYAGNIVSMSNGVSAQSITTQYAYDDANRVKIVSSGIAESPSYPSILFDASALSPAAYGPLGLSNVEYGENVTANTVMASLKRTYDVRARVLSETIDANEELLTAATNSMWTLNIQGSEQSSTSAGAPGSKTVTVSGASTTTGGGIVVTVNGQQAASVTYTANESSSTLTTQLANAITSTSAYAKATASGSVLTITAKTSGSKTNYTYSVVAHPGGSGGTFSFNAATGTLAGGIDAVTTYNSGTMTISVNGARASYSWSNGDTPSTIASGLTRSLQNAAGSFLSASFNSTNCTTSTPVSCPIKLSSTGTGASTNWPISVSSTYNTAYFSAASFSGSSTQTQSGTNAGYGASTLYSFAIPSSGGYDGVGNIHSVQDSAIGSWSYGYDSLNRLTSGASSAGFYNGTQIAWVYDGFGNRTSETFSGSPQVSLPGSSNMTYLNSNRINTTSLTSSGSVTYDASGNLTYDGLNTYLYDAEGRVCAVMNYSGSVTVYLYDAEGRRVSKGTANTFSCNNLASNGYTESSSYVLGLDGAQYSELSVTSNKATWLHTNVFIGGSLLATYTGSDTFFAFTDWLGTKRAELTPDGLHSVFTSLPYGNGLSSSGDAIDATEHHFTGKERDQESGNDYFGARYYASSMGRWLSPDFSDAAVPIPFANLNDPQTLNLYAYVRNNPLGIVDANGHGWWGDFWKGLSNATWKPLVSMVEHPIIAGKAIKNAAIHPVATYHAMKSGVVTTTQQVMTGNGEAIGLAVGTVGMNFIPGAGEAGDAAEVASDVEKVGQAAEAAADAAKAAEGLGNVGGGATTAANALTQANKYLGPGAKEIAPGVFRSADGTRQFRMTTSDLTGAHGDIGPHVHFESIGADGRTITENSHVGITNP